MNQYKLTIAIPTFDRPKEIVQAVQALTGQLDDTTAIIIIDNDSPRFPADELTAVLGQLNPRQYRIIRNNTNIGGNANILRCYEYATTKWLWILGDDDVALSDAVAKIDRGILQYPDALVLNFGSHLHLRPMPFVTTGLQELVTRFDSFDNLLFTSASVINVNKLRAALRYGYSFAYSNAPHLAVLLNSVGSDGRCAFLTEQIVTSEPTPPDQRWNVLNHMSRIATLAEAAPTPASRKSLSTRIAASAFSLRLLFIGCLSQAVADGDPSASIEVYKRVCHRHGWTRIPLVAGSAAMIGVIGLRLYRLVSPLISVLLRRQGKRSIQQRSKEISASIHRA